MTTARAYWRAGPAVDVRVPVQPSVRGRRARGSTLFGVDSESDGTARILLVDDEQAIQTLLAYPLRKDGYEVVSAVDGREALDRFGEQRFDLVVLDIMLPKLDGIEVCRRLRSRSQVPIIMLTAKDDEIDKVLGLEMGADDYITKPFSVREFRSRVKAALRRGGDARRGHAGRRADRRRRAAIDFERRWSSVARARRSGSPTSSSRSSPRSRASPGRVMTREVLLEQVWGDSAYRDPRTIDVHIRHLREKLERDPRSSPSTCSRFAASATASATNEAMSSVRNRLVLLFFAITAAAVGFVYLYVVPQLRSSLTAEKLRGLEAGRAGGARPARRGDAHGDSSRPSSGAWSATLATGAESRVTRARRPRRDRPARSPRS